MSKKEGVEGGSLTERRTSAEFTLRQDIFEKARTAKIPHAFYNSSSSIQVQMDIFQTQNQISHIVCRVQMRILYLRKVTVIFTHSECGDTHHWRDKDQ